MNLESVVPTGTGSQVGTVLSDWIRESDVIHIDSTLPRYSQACRRCTDKQSEGKQIRTVLGTR
jgi:hypothetical protein